MQSVPEHSFIKAPRVYVLLQYVHDIATFERFLNIFINLNPYRCLDGGTPSSAPTPVKLWLISNVM